MAELNSTARFFFDGLDSSAQGLLVVLEHARATDSKYRVRGLTAKQIQMSGLLLTGQISEVAHALEQVPGAVRYNE